MKFHISPYAQSLPDPGPDDHDSENLTKGWKMKFKQNNINAYFCSKTTIDFESKMRRLEREKLLEMKRRKELAWTERRRELKDEQEQRRMRLEQGRF